MYHSASVGVATFLETVEEMRIVVYSLSSFLHDHRMIIQNLNPGNQCHIQCFTSELYFNNLFKFRVRLQHLPLL